MKTNFLDRSGVSRELIKINSRHGLFGISGIRGETAQYLRIQNLSSAVPGGDKIAVSAIVEQRSQM